MICWSNSITFLECTVQGSRGVVLSQPSPPVLAHSPVSQLDCKLINISVTICRYIYPVCSRLLATHTHTCISSTLCNANRIMYQQHQYTQQCTGHQRGVNQLTLLYYVHFVYVCSQTLSLVVIQYTCYIVASKQMCSNINEYSGRKPLYDRDSKLKRLQKNPKRWEKEEKENNVIKSEIFKCSIA